MSYVYIDDSTTAPILSKLRKRLGISSEEVVRLGLDLVRDKVEPSPELRLRIDAFIRGEREPARHARADELRAKLDAWRAANPLPAPTGTKADKAFFDEMWGETPD